MRTTTLNQPLFLVVHPARHQYKADFETAGRHEIREAFGSVVLQGGGCDVTVLKQAIHGIDRHSLGRFEAAAQCAPSPRPTAVD